MHDARSWFHLCTLECRLCWKVTSNPYNTVNHVGIKFGIVKLGVSALQNAQMLDHGFIYDQ